MRIFTFFEPRPGDRDVRLQLCAWKTAWQAAGYRPVIANGELVDQGRVAGETTVGRFARPLTCAPENTDSYFRDMAGIPLSAGVRADSQAYWQITLAPALAKMFGQGTTVLDVGSGHGRAVERMSTAGLRVATQDIAPGCTVDLSAPIEEIPAKSYDVVSAFDVVEHVRDQHAFVAHMKRIARKAVLVTTPNWLALGNRNPFHYRELVPSEALDLLGGQHAFLRGWTADPLGVICEQMFGDLWNALDCQTFCVLASA